LGFLIKGEVQSYFISSGLCHFNTSRYNRLREERRSNASHRACLLICNSFCIIRFIAYELFEFVFPGAYLELQMVSTLHLRNDRLMAR